MYISAHPLDKFRLEIDEFTNADIAKVNEAESRMAVDKSYRDKVFFVAGIVTATEGGISKTNKPWSSFTIEDFTGQHIFRLFGKDHENFMKYTTLHNQLFISHPMAQESLRGGLLPGGDAPQNGGARRSDRRL